MADAPRGRALVLRELDLVPGPGGFPCYLPLDTTPMSLLRRSGPASAPEGRKLGDFEAISVRIAFLQGAPIGRLAHQFGLTWDGIKRLLSGKQYALPAGKVSEEDHRVWHMVRQRAQGKLKIEAGRLGRSESA